MRKELSDELNRLRPRLNNELNATTTFLASLLSEHVINNEDKATIESKETPHKQVDKLIDILQRKPDQNFDKFLGILRFENSDLYDLLSGGSGSSGAAVKGAAKNDQVNSSLPDAQVTNEELKIKTRKVFAKIKASLDPRGHVVDTLFAEEIITPRELKEITNGPDKETRAGCLLSHLFDTPHPRAFVVFREALKEDYGWVVDIIDKVQ